MAESARHYGRTIANARVARPIRFDDLIDPTDYKEDPVHRTASTVASTVASLAASLASFCCTLALADGQLSIRELARDNALLVVGADDIQASLERLGPTALGKLWNDAELADAVKLFKEGMEKGITEAAVEAGVAREDIFWPSSAGFALTIGLDEELGAPMLEYIGFCDWRSDEAKAVKFCDAMLETMEKKAKEAGAAFKSDEVRGRRVLIASSVDEAAGADAADADGGEDGEMDPDFEQDFGMGMPDMMPKEFCVASDKGRLFIASSKSMMDTLLARVDGDHAKSIGESAAFKAATELSGGTQDIYGAVMLDAAKPLLTTLPQYTLVEPIIARLFGNVQAVSFGLHAKDGVLEQCGGIYTPDGKVGLLSLVDLATEPKPAPAIVSSDATGYWRLNVRFDQFVPMLDQVIAGLPADQGDMVKPQLDMYRPAMTAAFAALGPEIHGWSLDPDPAVLMDESSVTAMAMRNDKESVAAVSDFISLLPLGLQSRDFNGMTILSDEFAPIAIGMGGGYLVLGEVKQVEQALRAVDAKAVAGAEVGLAGNKEYAAAFAAMSKDPVVLTAWADFGRQLKSTAESFRAMSTQVEAMAGMEDEEVPGLGVGLDDVNAFTELLKPEAMGRCVGDATFDLKALPAGYAFRYRLLPAATK